ncbi:hypothetical protein [Terricaulis sp.]|uniref:hypothetical protein n=1 Tax=Terricaulis sp. TaxID=2768686 RepID=UPI0037833009
MYIDFNQIARIAKFVALFAFFLPWVTVSCSGNEMLQATGWQLMTGDPQPVGMMENARDQLKDIEPSAVVIAAFAVILIGLVTSLFNRAQAAAICLLVSALLGTGVTYFGMQSLETQLKEQIAGASDRQQPDENAFISPEQQRQLSQSVAENIHVRPEEGYWLTLGALALAALFSLLTLMRRPQAQAPPSPSTS